MGADGFDTATADPAFPAGFPEVEGYQILGVLGRGGMGVVYLARQVGLDRRVALKMLHSPGAGADDLARFRLEAEAVARLAHPNIVAIYDVGWSDGRPYCALEYVEGGSLHDRIAGIPQPPRKAAELVETVARAVHAAHRAQIVHRDLKPGNILLTREGAPKVADFGLAKRLDSASDLTGSGAMVGTPSFMAPEQAVGRSREAGPAADIYALGAILYAMLAGRPPFSAGTALETLQLVVERDPDPPSRFSPNVPRDLETVCLKCLSNEPGRRYRTAWDLADDLRRFLDDKPVTARPVGRAERAWRWCRRNPAVASLAGSLAAVMIVALAVVGWLLAVERSARRVAEVARTEARDAADRAEANLRDAESARAAAESARAAAAENFRLARKVVDDCVSLTQESPAFRGDESRRARRVLLEALLPHHRRFLEMDDAGKTLADAAYAHAVAARAAQDLDDYAGAVTLFRRALSILERLSAAEPGSVKLRRETAAVRGGIASSLVMTGRRAEAHAEFAAARRLYQELEAERPDDLHIRKLSAQGRLNLGQLYAMEGRLQEAIAEQVEGVRMLEGILAARAERLGTAGAGSAGAAAPAAPDGDGDGDEAYGDDIRAALAVGCNQAATFCRKAGRPEDSLDWARRAYSIRAAMAERSPTLERRSQLAASLFTIGTILEDADDLKQALEAYGDALNLRAKLAAIDPGSFRLREALGVSHYRIGRLLSRLERYPEAVEQLTAAREVREAVLRDRIAPDPARAAFQLAVAENTLGEVFGLMGRRADAVRTLRSAGEKLERYAAEHPTDPDAKRELEINRRLTARYSEVGPQP
jgi:tetratricopeptide (TPR) repeat protein